MTDELRKLVEKWRSYSDPSSGRRADELEAALDAQPSTDELLYELEEKAVWWVLRKHAHEDYSVHARVTVETCWATGWGRNLHEALTALLAELEEKGGE